MVSTEREGVELRVGVPGIRQKPASTTSAEENYSMAA